MIKGSIFSAILMVICFAEVSFGLDEEWCLTLEKNAIKVYARAQSNSTLREYRAETILDEDMVSVSAVLDDIPAAVEWFPFCRFAGVVDELADGRKIIINIADLPWPFQDRYAVFTSRRQVDEARRQVVIDFEIDDASKDRSVEALVNTDALVKVMVMEGQWALSMLDENKTKVTYRVCADAGGHIPGWLISTFFDDTPYKTLENLRRFVKKPEYQQDSEPEERRQSLSIF